MHLVILTDIYTTYMIVKVMKILSWVLILTGPWVIQAQPFSAYTNVRQEFYVFDNGAMHRAEAFSPIDYKIGRNLIAYVDNQQNFKVFKDGEVSMVNDNNTTSFAVSDNLLVYKNASLLSVIDGNDQILLSRLCDRYALGDSIVMFYDLNRQTFNAYYNGNITELESFLNIQEDDFSFDKTVKVSDNVGAYINYNGLFKLFYNNKVETLESQPVREFQVGRNIVAYTDINNIFKINYQGQEFTIDPFPPKSFQVGDDVVAFENNDGYFKIFYKGSVYTIGYYQPNYKVADRIVAFEDLNGYLKVFYEGEQTVIDNYYPEKMELGYNSLAYINKASMLRMFSKGKVYDVSAMSLLEMRLDYDVLQFKVGFNAFRMFYNGEFYN